MGGECSSDGCPVGYKVKITNPTDRDADVQACILVESPQIHLPLVSAGAGLTVRAHTGRTARARFVVPIAKDAAKDLAGQRVSCTGLDWHGNPPD
jgi:hypothetical protein